MSVDLHNPFVVTPFNAALFKDEYCLSPAYYGTYRNGDGYSSIFLPDATCLTDTDWFANSAESASIGYPTRPIQQLVWLEEKDIDEQLRVQAPTFREELDSFLEHLEQDSIDSATTIMDDNEQVTIVRPPSNSYELLYGHRQAVLLSVSADKARTIDTLLPRFWRSTILPMEPFPYAPISSKATARIEDVLSTLQFDPDVASIVNSISIDQIKNDIRFLTGEDGKSGIVSRHSFADGSRVASEWLKDRIEGTGATCELRPFLAGFAPNVICRYSASINTTETVLISAHYDSRGSFGNTRAPGGDDDGSGTTGILNIARIIGAKGLKFGANVELVLFAGEEQGLLGSKAYSRELKAANANLTLVIQADMTAYHHPDEPAQLGLPATIGSPEVSDLVAAIASIYSPELTVGYTSACCSDHQSFHEQGFPATQVFERAGSIIDPMYHNSGDLSDRAGYDFEQLKSIAKVQFATVLHTAGFEVTK